MLNPPPPNNILSNYVDQPRFHSIYSDTVDRPWEIFRYFVHVHMWDGFVYLFLLVWNSEPSDAELNYELSLIQGHLSNLNVSAGYNEEKNSKVNEMITQFMECRTTRDEVLRNEVMNKVYEQLSMQSIYQPGLSLLTNLLNSMSSLQRQALRHTFISRIYGYSKFAEYLSKEWKNKLNDKTNENSYMLRKDRDNLSILQEQTRKTEIEDGIKQLLDIPSYADIVKQESDNNNVDKEEHKSNEFSSNSLTNDKNSSSDILEIGSTAEKKMGITINSEIEKKKEGKSKFVCNEKRSEEKSNIKVEKTISVTSYSESSSKEKVKEEAIQENNIMYLKTETNEKDKPRSYSREYEAHDFPNEYQRESPKTFMKNISFDKFINEDSQENEIQEGQKVDSKLVKLQQENEKLRLEAARHQAALGGIMNVGWSDNDPNNSMQLTKDIEKLQKGLADFTRVKRGINIKIDAVGKFLKNNKCRTKEDSKSMKLVLGAVLQQRLIRYILDSAGEYFKTALNDIPINNDFISCITDDKLEAAIFSRTKELIELTKRFAGTNAGTDIHIQLLPIKIRQHIYAALGQRGFINSNNPFIGYLMNTTLSNMNNYRIITDKEKNEKIESEVVPIIRQILHIFYFRRYTQEPYPSIKFYQSGDDFDPGVMESIGQIEQDNDEDSEELEVEICSFPVVAILEEEERRVFTKAQVIVRHKKQSYSKILSKSHHYKTLESSHFMLIIDFS